MKSDTKFLIVGLGLIGGCYARRLTALGHRVCALDTDPDAIAYALEEGIIARGAAMDEALVREADVVIFGLYPKALLAWLRAHQGALRPGALLTDVSGVKCGVVDEVQSFLRPDVEFVGAHPMAGREVSGVRLQLHVRHPQRRLAREQQQAQQPDPRAEVAHARPAPQLRERAEQERVRPWAEGRLVIDIPHPARPEPVRFLHRAPSSACFFLPLYDKTARGARKKHRSGQAPVLFQHAM